MTYLICLLLVIGSQIADYGSTLYALQHGASEANPIVRYVGLIPSKLIVVGIAAAVMAFIGNESRIYLTIGIVAIYTWVTIHNILAVR